MTSKKPKMNQLEELGSLIQTNIPTNNISREALAELIGEAVEYQTGAGYEYDDLTLKIPDYAAGRYTPDDVIRALGVENMNAVLRVTLTNEESEHTNYDGITIRFH